MGRAYNMAQKARLKNAGNREPVFKFKEIEFRRFVYYLTSEQKNICSQQARDIMPRMNSNFVADVIESAPDVEVF